MGMLLLAGAVFLSLSALSASARTGDASTAEPVVNDLPVALPSGAEFPVPPPIAELFEPQEAPPVEPTPVHGGTGPLPGPRGSGVGIRPVGFDQPIGVRVTPQPINPEPDPAGGGAPWDVRPIPIDPATEIV